MEEYTFDIEFITPLFMSGADRTKAELRAPSIKGAMRFWFRAMMGKMLKDDVDSIRAIEGELFGNTIDEKRSTASKFGIETNVISSSQYDISQQPGFLPGLRYLGFPFYSRRDVARPGIALASKYNYSIKMRHTCSETEAQVILATLWLLSNLGNLGSRSRRGFGGFNTTRQQGDSAGLDFKSPASIDKMATYLQDGKIKVEKLFSTYAEQKSTYEVAQIDNTSLPPFDSFSHWNGIVLKSAKSPWPDWISALNEFGIHMRNFRQIQNTTGQRPQTHGSQYPHKQTIVVTQDYDKVIRNFLSGKPLVPMPDLAHDIFGLPVQYRSPSLKATAMLSWEKDGHRGDRRASPLLIRPVLCGGEYGLIVQYFESKFLPDGAKETLSSGGKKLIIKEADYAVLKTDFFARLQKDFKSYQI